MLAAVVTVAAMRKMSTQGGDWQRREKRGKGGKQENEKETKRRERTQTTVPLREANLKSDEKQRRDDKKRLRATVSLCRKKRSDHAGKRAELEE
jgi:hypothetical protein